jgi:hypothetical protein
MTNNAVINASIGARYTYGPRIHRRPGRSERVIIGGDSCLRAAHPNHNLLWSGESSGYPPGVICGVYTTASATLVNRYAGGTWKGFLNLSGIATSVPDCTSMNSAGNVVCFAEGIDNGIYGTRFNGGAWTLSSWSGYGGIGGRVIANASCTSQSPDLLVCGALDPTNNALWSDVYNGSNWSGWSKVGGLGMNSPACAPLGTGQVICVVLGINNKLTSVVGP